MLTFEWKNDHRLKIVHQEREKYKKISRILNAHPVILDMVHEDLKTLSQDSRSGQRVREGDFTSETVLRTLIVHMVEGLSSFRDTVIRVQESSPVEEKPIRFYDDDGTEINPDIIAKPSLCTSCEKDDDPSEGPLRTLNRLDQRGEEEFRCDAFVSKAGSSED